MGWGKVWRGGLRGVDVEGRVEGEFESTQRGDVGMDGNLEAGMEGVRAWSLGVR